MATSLASSATISGGCNLKKQQILSSKCSDSRNLDKISMAMKSNRLGINRKFSVRAEYSNDKGGSGGDFVAGFFLGGAIFGTLAYVFAPQIRRSVLNEDEDGFQRATKPMYYDDEGLEKTRQTLNAKLSQLNAAIDNVSSRLRGGNNAPVESDSEVEATM